MRFRYYALILVGINVFVFILQNFIPFINQNFILVSSEVWSKPWMLITSMFLHANIGHIMYNMLALALFGSILEGIIGSRKFLWIYLIGGIIAGIVATPFYTAALGASGAIFGILGVLTVLRPKMVIWLNFMPVPMWLAAVIWAIIDISGVFLPGNVANIAHLSGLFFGLVVGFSIRERYREEREDRGFFRRKPLSERDINEWEEDYMR